MIVRALGAAAFHTNVINLNQNKNNIALLAQ
jgi:hypothetical protein